MSITTYDQKLFADACQKIVAKERETNGIGTLKEKTMHAVLKELTFPNRKKKLTALLRIFCVMMRL